MLIADNIASTISEFVSSETREKMSCSLIVAYTKEPRQNVNTMNLIKENGELALRSTTKPTTPAIIVAMVEPTFSYPV